jgi:hypothetical protein
VLYEELRLGGSYAAFGSAPGMLRYLLPGAVEFRRVGPWRLYWRHITREIFQSCFHSSDCRASREQTSTYRCVVLQAVRALPQANPIRLGKGCRATRNTAGDYEQIWSFKRLRILDRHLRRVELRARAPSKCSEEILGTARRRMEVETQHSQSQART